MSVDVRVRTVSTGTGHITHEIDVYDGEKMKLLVSVSSSFPSLAESDNIQVLGYEAYRKLVELCNQAHAKLTAMGLLPPPASKAHSQGPYR